MNSVYIGIDTSNYRTSVAAVDERGHAVFQKAVLLDVVQGERGLRQSDAFFRHSNRLPEYLRELLSQIDTASVKAVGVSERPRRVEGSYMPCFMAGVNAAGILGSALDLPVYGFSHQEGHAAAILENDGSIPPERCLFFHLSGGTTEALLCSPDDNGYSMEITGGTLDISIGQLFDRYGVAMGMPFPAGRYLDDIAYKALEDAGFDPKAVAVTGVMPKLKIKDGYFNLSGAETRLMKYASSCSNEKDAEGVTAELFVSIAKLLTDEAAYLSDRYGIIDIYMAGGAASSRTVRRLLSAFRRSDIKFGDASLSGDNAVGTALLAKRVHETGNRNSSK